MNTILALLVVLYGEHIPHGRRPWLDRARAWRRVNTFSSYVPWLIDLLTRRALLAHWTGALLLLLPLPCAVFVVQWLLGSGLSWQTCLFYVLVLFVTLRQWDDPAEHTGSTLEHQVERLAWNAVDGQYGVLLWFVLLGPFGAVLYRLSSVLYHSSEAARHFAQGTYWAHYSLAWLPARITSMLAALVGSFEPAFVCWRNSLGTPITNEILVRDCALAALHAEERAVGCSSALALFRRISLAWLVVVVILFLAGWTF